MKSSGLGSRSISFFQPLLCHAFSTRPANGCTGISFFADVFVHFSSLALVLKDVEITMRPSPPLWLSVKSLQRRFAISPVRPPPTMNARVFQTTRRGDRRGSVVSETTCSSSNPAVSRQLARLSDFAGRYLSARKVASGLRSSRSNSTASSSRALLVEDLRQVAMERPRFGYRRLHVMLRRKGWTVNRKLRLRLVRENGWLVRRRQRKKLATCRASPCRSRLGRTRPRRWTSSSTAPPAGGSFP